MNPVAFDPPHSLRAAPARCALATGLAVVALLGACSTTTAPKYVEPPATVANARVRVVNVHAQAYYASIAVFDSATCFDKADLGMTGGNSADNVRIDMLGEQPVSASTIERHVRAGEPLVIGPRSVFPSATTSEMMHVLLPATQEQMRARQAGVCKIPSFVPKLDEQYEVVVDLTPAHCTVTPYRLVDDNGTVKREKVQTQSSRISTYEFDMKCFM
jgi:hypothetical protein